MNKIEETMKDLISVMGKEMMDKNINLFSNTLNIYNAIWYNFPDKEKFEIDEFYIRNTYNFENFVEWYVLTKLTNWKMNDKLIFLIQQLFFVQNSFEKLIVKNEWSACSVDKSSFIIRQLYYYFLEWKEMDFNPFIDDKWRDYSYHIPKRIFTSQIKVLEFFEALMYLYYWDWIKYINFMSELDRREILVLDILNERLENNRKMFEYLKDNPNRDNSRKKDSNYYENDINITNKSLESNIIIIDDEFIDYIKYISNIYSYQKSEWLYNFMQENIWNQFSFNELDEKIKVFK